MGLVPASRQMNLARGLGISDNNKNIDNNSNAEKSEVKMEVESNFDALKVSQNISSTGGDDKSKPDKLKEQQHETIKCSAVHTLDRDMPDFDYTHLVTRLREQVLEDYEQNPGIYSQTDIEQLKADDWMVARYILRHKCDLTLAFDQIRRSLRLKHESLCNSIRREDFPAEFYKLGGLFTYEPDRRGNVMLYIRVKVHRKVSEIQSVLHAFFYYNLMRADQLARGRGKFSSLSL